MWGHIGPADNWPLDSQGYLQRNVDTTSLDGTVSIHIPSGTEMLDSSDNPLNEIRVETADPPANPPAGYHVLQAFAFNPDGATFNPGMKITISFDPSEITLDKILVLAFYNETAGEWELIRGTINENDTATFNISHFSVYALMYQDDSSPATVSGHKDKGLSTNQLIALVVVAALAAASIATLIILQIKRRRPGVRLHRRTSKSSKKLTPI